MAGPTRDPRTDTGAGGDTKSEPVYLEGTEGGKGIGSGRTSVVRAANSSLVLVAIEAADADGGRANDGRPEIAALSSRPVIADK